VNDQPDFDLALRNLRKDFLGEWCRDPWDWPELQWLVRTAQSFAISRLRTHRAGRVVRVDVPKTDFGFRPVLVIDPVDRLLYQGLVDSLSGDLLGGMKTWVFGWRLGGRNSVPGRFATNRHEWKRYTRHLQMLAHLYEYALSSDVLAFSHSIRIDQLAEAILARSGPTPMAERLVCMLRTWDGLEDCFGLPAGYASSVVLGNFYLAPLDEALDKEAKEEPWAGGRASASARARYIDNIWIFSGSLATVRSAEARLRETLAGLGLQMNLAKTQLLQGEDIGSEVELATHAKAEAALSDPIRASHALNELVDRFLANPEHADRTWVRLATSCMKTQGSLGRIQELMAVVARMPHCSDILAMLFRTSGQWRQLEDWYIEFVTRAEGWTAWSLAELTRMFPNDEPPGAIVQEYVATRLIEAPSFEGAAVAAQRLAAWDPLRGREAIRATERIADDPYVRRVLALAAIMCGEDRPNVRKLLSDFEENAVTLAMLEAREFRALRVAPGW
jgi:Reverse transcriptase (RNA-dependent DNA polymerase)